MNPCRYSALMIATHSYPGPLENTLIAAHKVFRPEQIYVCHNGPRQAPNDEATTYNLCVELSNQCNADAENADKFSDGDKTINYQWSSAPNKTLAFYVGTPLLIEQQACISFLTILGALNLCQVVHFYS